MEEISFLFVCVYFTILLAIVGASVFLDRASRNGRWAERERQSWPLMMKRVSAGLYVLAFIGIAVFIYYVSNQAEIIE